MIPLKAQLIGPGVSHVVCKARHKPLPAGLGPVNKYHGISLPPELFGNQHNKRVYAVTLPVSYCQSKETVVFLVDKALGAEVVKKNKDGLLCKSGKIRGDLFESANGGAKEIELS